MSSNAPWVGTAGTLIALYLALSVVSTRFLYLQLRQQGHARQSFFYSCVTIGLITRVVYFSVVAATTEDGAHVRLSGPLYFLVNTCSPLAFFSAFFQLLFLLVEVYHAASPQRVHQQVFIVANALLYTSYTVLTILNFVFTTSRQVNDLAPSNIYESIVVAESASLYAVTAVSFLIYGGRMRALLSRSTSVAALARDLAFRIGAMTILTTSFFLIRSAIVLVALFSKALNFDWWFMLGYFALLEWTPVVLMLALLRQQHSLTGSGSYQAGPAAKLLVKQRPPGYLSLADSRQPPLAVRAPAASGTTTPPVAGSPGTVLVSSHSLGGGNTSMQQIP